MTGKIGTYDERVSTWHTALSKVLRLSDGDPDKWTALSALAKAGDDLFEEAWEYGDPYDPVYDD